MSEKANETEQAEATAADANAAEAAAPEAAVVEAAGPEAAVVEAAAPETAAETTPETAPAEVAAPDASASEAPAEEKPAAKAKAKSPAKAKTASKAKAAAKAQAVADAEAAAEPKPAEEAPEAAPEPDAEKPAMQVAFSADPAATDVPVTEVDIKLLLEAGVHFGHQTKRWNPKMARYIFSKRNDIHIIDLQKTLKALRRSRKFLMDIVAKGGSVMFVSTKRQAQEIVEREARRGGAYWASERWLGGMLTNFETIQKRVKHLKHLEKMEDDGLMSALGKKEASRLRKQMARLEKYLCGVKEMKTLPDALIIIDPRREQIAVKEARKLKIPIVAVVDTNCDPDEIDHVIPGNDDAIRSIRVLTQYLASGLAEVHETRQRKAAEAKAAENKDDEAKDDHGRRGSAKKATAKKATAKKATAKKAIAKTPKTPEVPPAESPAAGESTPASP